MQKAFTLFYDEIYSSGLDSSARFPVDRYAKVYEKLCVLDTGEHINLSLIHI